MTLRRAVIPASVEKAPQESSDQEIVGRLPPRSIDMTERVAELACTYGRHPMFEQTIKMRRFSRRKDRCHFRMRGRAAFQFGSAARQHYGQASRHFREAACMLASPSPTGKLSVPEEGASSSSNFCNNTQAKKNTLLIIAEVGQVAPAITSFTGREISQ
jgi:hypothetical protein